MVPVERQARLAALSHPWPTLHTLNRLGSKLVHTHTHQTRAGPFPNCLVKQILLSQRGASKQLCVVTAQDFLSLSRPRHDPSIPCYCNRSQTFLLVRDWEQLRRHEILETLAVG